VKPGEGMGSRSNNNPYLYVGRPEVDLGARRRRLGLGSVTPSTAAAKPSSHALSNSSLGLARAAGQNTLAGWIGMEEYWAEMLRGCDA